MTKVVRISAGEEPSGYSNHDLVEQTTAATFRATGASNKGDVPDYFAPPQASDLATLLKLAAVAWADEKGIPTIHVKMQVTH